MADHDANPDRGLPPPDHAVPPVQAWFQNGFHRFLRPYLRRHFHAVAIERDSLARVRIDDSLPLVVYSNHPSWWDPLIGHFLHRVAFPNRQFYAPIDAAALEHYGVFEKLGFYGVRLESLHGARAFLTKSLAIASAAGTAIWITPEGRFRDARDHAAELMPGLPHLCRRMETGVAVPLALEYAFWDERLPNCFARFGPPIPVDDSPRLSKPEWDRMLTAAMRANQAALAEHVIRRRDDPFENLLRGRLGAGGVYDTMRRMKAWARGRAFRATHGDHFQ